MLKENAVRIWLMEITRQLENDDKNDFNLKVELIKRVQLETTKEVLVAILQDGV